MKTVFSNSQCAHVWAQQSQQHGRGASVSFDGPSFKSYATTIAKFVRGVSRETETGTVPGRDIVLFSSQSYSVTTNGKHKALARRAIRGGVPNYTVPTIEAGGWNHSDLDHAANLAYLVQDYRDRGERLMHAAGIYQESADALCAVLAEVLAVATNYARDFGLPDPAPREIQPASAARQIRARLERLTPGRASRLEEARVARVIRERENVLIKAADDAAKRLAWRDGRMIIPGHLNCPDGGAMLRITERGADCGPIVQTSWGAEAPMSDARRGLKMWRRCVNAGAVYPGPAFEDTGLKLKLGHFTLDAIDAAGNVKARCHTFYRAELERFEKLLAAPPPPQITRVDPLTFGA